MCPYPRVHASARMLGLAFWHISRSAATVNRDSPSFSHIFPPVDAVGPLRPAAREVRGVERTRKRSPGGRPSDTRLPSVK